MASVSISANGAMTGPYLYSTVTVSEKSRSGTSVVLNVKIVSHLQYEQSYLGNGYTITGKVTAYGVSKNFTLKTSSSNWNGNGDHTVTGTMTITVPATTTSITVGYKCIVDGYGGTEKTGTSKSLTLSKVLASVTSAPDFSDTSNPTVKFSNPSKLKVRPYLNFYDKKGETLLLTLYPPTSKVGRYGSVLSTSYTWDLDDNYSTNLTYRNKIRNVLGTKSSCYVALGLNTYIGETYQGYSSKGATFTNKLSPPTFETFSFENIDEKTLNLTGNDPNKFINGYSTLKVIISDINKAVANKGATMSHYLINGKKYTYSENFEQPIENWKNSSVEIFAVDSRGLSTQRILPCELIDYTPLQKGNIVAKREGGVGEKTTLVYDGSIWNNWFGGAKNQGVENKIKSVKYTYQIGTEDIFVGETDITPTVTDNNFAYEDEIQGDGEIEGFSIENAYNLVVVVEDELSTATYTALVPSGIPAIAIYKNNVAVHGKYDTELGGNQINGGLYLDKQKIIPNDMITLQKNEDDTNMSTTLNYYNIGLGTVKAKIGTKLMRATTESQLTSTPANVSGVKIGKGVSKVKANSNMQFTNNNNTSDMYFVSYIYRFRPSSDTNGTGEIMSRSISANIAKTLSVSAINAPVIFDVEEGDIIYLRAFKSMSNGVASVNGESRTTLTVEVVE